MKKVLLLISFFLITALGCAQVNGTKGKEFWVSFMANNGSNPKQLSLHFSGTKNAVVTITNPNDSYTKTLTVPANTLVSDTVSTNFCINNVSGTAANKVLKITSTTEITVYAFNYLAQSADASVILPTPALGVNYRVMAYKGYIASTPSEFCIVATQNNTQINITPSCNTLDNKVKNVTYSVTLNLGQSYQVQAKTDSDLTGTLIEVQNCKPIAVFGGSKCSTVPQICTQCDHLFEQLYPLNTWGKKFILVPTSGRTVDRFVILADKGSTSLSVGGVPVTLTYAGDKYEAYFNSPIYVSSNKPVCICVYAVGQSCAGNGDPMMMWVTPIEQSINDITFVALTSALITNHYVNIVAKSASVSSVKLNGVGIGALFSPVPGNSAFSYIQKSISSGANTINSDSGVIAYAYGYGNFESYGYNIGSSIYDLVRYFTVNNVQNDNAIDPAKATKICINTPVLFKGFSGNYTPLYWRWRFNNDTASSQNVTHTFTDTGLVKVMMITPRLMSNNLCSASDTLIDTAIQYIRIVNPQVNILTPDTTVCLGNSFKVRTSYSGDSVFSWNGGADMNCLTCAQPVIKPGASRWYNVSFGNMPACIMSDSIFVHVVDSTVLGIPNDMLICKGNKAILQVDVLNPDAAIIYNYELYAGNTLVGQDPNGSFQVYPDTNTSYTFKVNNGCYTATTSPVKVYVRDPLQLLFTDSFLVCRNKNNSFKFKAQGGDSSYTIYLLRNNVVIDSIRNAAPGIYYGFNFFPDPLAAFKLVLTDGCTNKADTESVHFKYRPVLSFKHTPDTLVCKGAALPVYITPSGGDSTYTLYLISNKVAIDSVNNATIGNTYYFNIVAQTNAIYKIAISDGCTNINDTQQIRITVRAPLSFVLPVDTIICKGSVYDLPVTGTGGDSSYTYYVYNGTTLLDSIVNASAGVKYFFHLSPIVKTKYTIVQTDGCTIIAHILSYTIDIYPPLKVNVASTKTKICNGDTLTLFAGATGGMTGATVTYLWNKLAGGGNLVHIKPGVSGYYTVKADDGCLPVYDSIFINVEQLPIADFTSLDSTGCEPFDATFVNTSILQAPVSYLWNFGDGSSDTAANPAVHRYVKPGKYKVSLKAVSAFGCADSITKADYIEVYHNPVLSMKVDPKKIKVNDGKINFSQVNQFTDAFDIYFGDGQSASEPNTRYAFSHVYTDTGYFYIKLIARNNFNCSSELYDTVYLEDYYTYFIPSAFTPNNDGKNDYFKPVSTYTKKYEMNIYDRWGHLVFNEVCTNKWFECMGWDGTYQQQPLPPGIYIYTLLIKEDDRRNHTEEGKIMLLR